MNDGRDPTILSTPEARATEGVDKLMGLRLELRESQLSKKEFASAIGVDLPRLEYWLRFEAYRDELRKHRFVGLNKESSCGDETTTPAG